MLILGEWENCGQLSLQVSLEYRDLTLNNYGILGGVVSARSGKKKKNDQSVYGLFLLPLQTALPWTGASLIDSFGRWLIPRLSHLSVLYPTAYWLCCFAFKNFRMGEGAV